MASKYDKIIEHVFHRHYQDSDRIVSFDREDLVEASKSLGIARIRNLGDITYSFRFRRELPESIQSTAPENAEWIIAGSGIASYEFRLASPGKIAPNENLIQTKIPDSTPEILKKYAPGSDEQALLTKVRYNRLIDIFTGLTCYSIQNHLRTTVKGIGQIEIDEFYIGINKQGLHFVLPCQAKSPGDRFGIVQVMQDVEYCNTRYPEAVCKPLAFQFLSSNEVAILELAITEEDECLKLNVVEEKKFKLVPEKEIDNDELQRLKQQF